MKIGLAATAAAVALTAGTASAEITKVTGALEVINTESLAWGTTEDNSHLCVFQEARGLTLGEALDYDFSGKGKARGAKRSFNPGTIDAGTRVDVYTITLDTIDDFKARLKGNITFDNQILGVIVSGKTMDAADSVVGINGFNYPTHGDKYRGLESKNEWVHLFESGNRARVKMLGSADQIRIITLSTVPTPGAAAMLGLGGLAVARRRRR